ncbi:SOH1-domain-containing protein [Phakopsora pachyrhizi]|uniref:Mediator of RNA polymerase II transcription subunit 31 n=1 Tax=Phakopsora pachyrhizi TaxID=170000 RepID=A0AAV0AXY9_PHAPC|nr:SOH1-domain-containing protein [Phakopsora pachyrhizi]CAH7675256.1 SOH1-domain-containing protein [Phakopsora pachyrhizi]
MNDIKLPNNDPTNELVEDESEDLKLSKTENQIRFETDLEFVQSLANPHFVQELTLNGILKSECMINYLNHLKYFHQPNYSRFVRYPNALKILDLLNTSDQFRKMIENQECSQILTDKFIQHWIFLSGRLNRTTSSSKNPGNQSNTNSTTDITTKQPDSSQIVQD